MFIPLSTPFSKVKPPPPPRTKGLEARPATSLQLRGRRHALLERI